MLFFHFLSPFTYPLLLISFACIICPFHSISLSIYLPIYVSLYLSIYLSTYLCIYLSLYLSVYIFLYLRLLFCSPIQVLVSYDPEDILSPIYKFRLASCICGYVNCNINTQSFSFPWRWGWV
jgi:hypothetical protein